jgi:3-oxoacyl-[acyl-carrier-protein] synthase II
MNINTTRELQTVVLTGMGCITARGDLTLQGFTTPNDAQTFTLPDFKLESYLSSQKTYLDRCSAFALAGCALALRDAGLTWPLNDDTSTHDGLCGIALGTHLGCIETMKVFWDKATERGTRLANPLLFSHSYFNTPISLCAIEFGLKGYHTTFCAGQQSGIEAVRAALGAIQLGHAQMMLCGGVEAWTPTRALLEADSNVSTPLGEASVFFVLENARHAEQRNAANRIVLDQRVLDAATNDQSLYDNYGDCGGATSALSLASVIQGQHLPIHKPA